MQKEISVLQPVKLYYLRGPVLFGREAGGGMYVQVDKSNVIINLLFCDGRSTDMTKLNR